MEILYKACDGEIFETEEDCVYHETLLEIGDKPCAIFADWRGHVFTLKDALNHESGYSPESVMYMYAANSDLWACARDYLFEPYGIECPIGICPSPMMNRRHGFMMKVMAAGKPGQAKFKTILKLKKFLIK